MVRYLRKGVDVLNWVIGKIGCVVKSWDYLRVFGYIVRSFMFVFYSCYEFVFENKIGLMEVRVSSNKNGRLDLDWKSCFIYVFIEGIGLNL